ncbi:MAG: cell division ATP-binding protein FtsE [Candidatus Fischerbacteria bacterium RBG_13_37_8]|uniref:Cell division ATP-binding protein FtsE n=1 Tax=Candidatus Fischerbacteria bacterium RBG_13_37_8 TaxID=1817863 RepID=A0A1F5V959_9BACT|nr:MAG: cell division ATP-binding protein FtsE [Candidatus Fischerbacteria bacterium RBG_13_37_8]
MIKFFNVAKVYEGNNLAIDNATLSIEKGDFCFVTGPSGAGKSTFLKLILRQELPTKGQILVLGRNLSKLPMAQIPDFRRNIGFVFQDFKLLNRKTIYENVAIVLQILGTSFREQRLHVFEILRKVGLQHKLKSFPPMLSGGEQQRVAIARALINKPAILLADEPTGNLDPDLSLEIMEIFKSINRQGTTAVIATHDKELIRLIGGRIICLDRGQIVDDYTIVGGKK